MSSQEIDVAYKWMLALADPAGFRGDHNLPTLNAENIQALLEEARRNRITPIVLKELEAVDLSACAASIFADQKKLFLADKANMLRLRACASELLAQLPPGVAEIVKGPALADTVYAQPWLRPFTDIDLLVDPNRLHLIEDALRDLGFEYHPVAHRNDNCPEWKWLHKEAGSLMIELHPNLVHSRRMQKHISLALDDIATHPRSATNLLASTIIHGLVSDQFKHLGQIVDVALAAQNLQTTDDEVEFQAFCRKRQHRVFIHAGLSAAGHFFNSKRSLELAREIRPAMTSTPCGWLVRKAILRRGAEGTSSQRWARKLLRAGVCGEAEILRYLKRS